MYRHILIPTDGSELAQRAVPQGLALAKAVGAKVTRQQAFAAVKPGGAIMHIGLQDWASEIDMRKLTLAEITLQGTYTYTTADLRATVAALARGVFGDLSWVEERRLADGAQAFVDLDQGRCAAAKIVLKP